LRFLAVALLGDLRFDPPRTVGSGERGHLPRRTIMTATDTVEDVQTSSNRPTHIAYWIKLIFDSRKLQFL
jgi:hypothetical protein